MTIHAKPTPNELNYYKNKYFIGVDSNKRTQLLHFNKGGYELKNIICKNVVIFNKKDKEHEKRFNTLKDGPFSMNYKIPCLEYLFGIETTNQNWFILLINKIRKLWQK